MNKISLLCCLLLAMLFTSCEDYTYTPKPLAYPKIDFPAKTGYTLIPNDGCAFSFEYPSNAQLIRDTFFFQEEIISNCWYNIAYPSLKGKIHLSYKEIGKDISLEKVLEDSHELTYTHTKKADYIDEYAINNANGVKGIMFEVGGDAATNMQFYMTDMEKHYMRGALYFRASPNADSIAPVLDYVREDMMHLFETFKWTK